MPTRLFHCLFLLPVVLLSVSCQQGDGGPVMKAGPTVTVFGGYGEVDYRRGPVSSDLQWLVTAPSYNMGSDGTPRSIDDRVTLAVQSPSMATWLLSTRITGRAALTLSNSLQAGLQAWSDVPCLPMIEFPLELDVTMPEVQDQAPGNWGRIELAGTPARWMVLPHPGGNLARPAIGLGLVSRPVSTNDSNRSARLAIVTMDLVTARSMQRHLAGLASTVALGPDHVDAGDGADGAPGWTMLFDGTSLEHFRGFKKQIMPGGWEIVDGNLTLTGSGGDIITRQQYDNFEFELQWRVEEGGNSGIFFNVTEDKDYVWQTGPEMQILDDDRHQDGKNPLTSAGSNYGLHAPMQDVVRPAGQWNTARILVCENDVTYWLNDVEVVSYTLHSSRWDRLVSGSKFNAMPDYGRRAHGHIALQDHGDVVSYRNIRIRDLGASSIPPLGE
ncbi:MAG: DUF1080 domain-containing protein [Phycisphaerales bacterium]|nr:DUF1080 domain-containing protein [Phycisphaerales bacterium]